MPRKKTLLWAGAIVVMDNLNNVHYAHSVRYAIEAVGARMVFLSPSQLVIHRETVADAKYSVGNGYRLLVFTR